MLADRLLESAARQLADTGVEVTVESYELREVAQDVTNNLLTGFASPKLQAVIDAVTSADGLIAVTPIFTTSYSGLFKSFMDIIDPQALADLPVIIAATGGTPRHSLALEHAMRPLFSYLHAVVVPTSVYAASADWGAGASDDDARALPDRIAKAAGQLSALVSGPQRVQRDPWALDRPFGQLIGGLAGE
jgi:FMN reductase